MVDYILLVTGWGRVLLRGQEGQVPETLYQGLNNITVKNRYPLPLLSTAFELLQGATVFTKLELRNAYHLVGIIC